MFLCKGAGLCNVEVGWDAALTRHVKFAGSGLAAVLGCHSSPAATRERRRRRSPGSCLGALCTCPPQPGWSCAARFTRWKLPLASCHAAVCSYSRLLILILLFHFLLFLHLPLLFLLLFPPLHAGSVGGSSKCRGMALHQAPPMLSWPRLLP